MPEKNIIMTEARELLKKATVTYNNKPVGTVAALVAGDEALNYDQVFTRDFFVSAAAFILDGEYEIIKNFLSVTADMQSLNKSIDCFHAGQGLMPASFKIESKDGKDTLESDFGEKAIGRVTPVDSSLWWLYLLRIYIKASGNREFAGDEKITNAVKKILAHYAIGYFELIPALLVPDGAFMIDRRMGMYGHPLDIQVLLFIALKSAKEILEYNRKKNNKSVEEINHRIEHLVYHLLKYYWLDRKKLNAIYRYKTEEFGLEVSNQYNVYSGSIPGWVDSFIPDDGGYFIGNLGPGRMDFRFLSIGNLLGIISGLADKKKAAELARLIIQNRGAIIANMPAKVCYPALEGKQWEIITGYDPKNSAWSYHNGGNWPFVIWLLAASAAVEGTPILTSEDLETFAKRLSNDKWPEYYDGKEGRMIGKEARELQLWTIAGYIIAHHILDEPEKVSIFAFEPEEYELTCPVNRV
jgi:glycogen debranching enzyme